MKEAYGGTWLFTIVIVMLALFTSFISISTNYSRTYKVKDSIIAILESEKGLKTSAIKKINKELKRVGYSSTGKCHVPLNENYISNREGWYGFSRNIDERPIFTPMGGEGDTLANYCISVTDVASPIVGHPSRGYMTVVVFFQLDLPVLRDVFALRIAGETSYMVLAHDQVYLS